MVTKMQWLLLAAVVISTAPQDGELLETPNQARVRLGQPIEASYPAPDYGEAIETPNHRRARLGLPPPDSENYGVKEETPNQKRIKACYGVNVDGKPLGNPTCVERK